MSQKQIKKYRKLSRAVIDHNMKQSRELPFKVRVKLAWRLLWNKQ